MRRVLALWLASAGLWAQSVAPPRFWHLATTDDGSRLYFSSPTALAGAGSSALGKIFVLDNQGVHLFAQRNPFSLGWPSPSGDGSVVAFSGELASLAAEYQGNLALGNGAVFQTSAGLATLSRNGRFALFLPDFNHTIATLSDLADGTSAALPGDALVSMLPGGRSVASDGTAVVRGPSSIRIVQAAGVEEFPTPDVPHSAVIDDGADTVAYETQGQIFVLDLDSGTQTVVADNASAPALTNDGQLLIYLAPDENGTVQAWLIQRDGTGMRQLRSDDSGVAESVISGDGGTVYVLTNAMHVLRIDVASGDVRDLTPVILAAQSPVIVSFTAAAGELCYNVQNATAIRIQPGVGAVAGPSACVAASPTATTTYTLTAVNAGGSATATATLDAAAVKILTFTNDPVFSPASGSPVTLRWTTANAASVGITGLGLPAGTLPVNGSTVVNPVTDTTYTLTAYGTNGQAVSSVLSVFVR